MQRTSNEKCFLMANSLSEMESDNPKKVNKINNLARAVGQIGAPCKEYKMGVV